MDIGVSCYIGINATNAAYRHLKMIDSTGLKKTGFTDLLIRASPLLVLSLLRLISIKITGYPEHVSEYGVHWNFFLSLAFIMFLCDLTRRYIPPSSLHFIGKSFSLSVGLGLSILFISETILQGFDIVPIILSNENRPIRLKSFLDFVLMNKEGIASLPGGISCKF